MDESPSQEIKEENAVVDEDKVSSHKTKSYGISIDPGLIPSVPVEEQASVLRNLGVNVFNQDEFEEGVLKQVDEAIAVKETEELVRGWEKNLKAVNEDIRTVEEEIQGIDKILKQLEGKSGSGYEAWRRTQAVQKQKDNKLRQLKKLQATQKSLHNKLGLLDEDTDIDVPDKVNASDVAAHQSETHKVPVTLQNHSAKDELIKTGEMTPFGGTVGNAKDRKEIQLEKVGSFNEQSGDVDKRTQEVQRKSLVRSLADDGEISDNDDDNNDDDEFVPDDNELKYSWYEDDSEETKKVDLGKGKKPAASRRSLNVAYREEDGFKPKKKKKIKKKSRKIDTRPVDDGSEKMYRQRIRELRIKELLKKRKESQADESDEEELPDMEFDKGLKIPGKIWHKLYKYQQTGVQWLWELHCQQAGGIIGDEMGLGKTIQIIAFLTGLKHSKISAKKKKHGGLGPVLIICPVTVLHQWVQEFHKWWPEFRVAVLHETGTYQGFKQELIKKICTENGVLVTSYSGMRQHQDNLLAQRFDYVILDEGHKIRNPDAEITLACKQFRTPHRIILSGSPMQNNLRELWSLFDFVFPGKLGTLPVFMTEFSVPITMGGYSNATKVQVETAYKCACVLRDTINPYLLRRLKKDVKMSLDLPTKNEQVLFCRLTEEQRELYQQYLNSKEVQAILAGNYKMLNILEKFVVSKGYTYFRLDGSTPVASRQGLIKKYNEDRSIFMFLLTTRVGGLGVNLVGADRIIIYDPDWNPSTDTQARERAWRIGQKKPVTIYRLITTGTIEEKIYHRQIFKQFLTNRVLKDPKQRRFFKSNDLYELFTLDNCDKRYGTETSAIFAGSNCEVKVPGVHRKKRKMTGEEDATSKEKKGTKQAKKEVSKKVQDEGNDSGAFCIDWRDIQEAKNLTNDELKKDKISNCEGGEGEVTETGKQIVVGNIENGKKIGQMNATTSENFTEENAVSKNSSISEKEQAPPSPSEVTSIPARQDGIINSSLQLGMEAKTERKKTVTFAAENLVSGEGAKNQGTSGGYPKKRKNKISSLSDQELKKRIRMKEKKKKRRRAKIDGRAIDNLDYHEMYNPSNASQSSAEEMEEQKQHSAHQDEFILKHLFKKTGVHSALKHDVIMESSNPDLALVESEANRVAENAVKALKRSRRQCLGAASGVPTWTGSSGSSGLSEPPPKRPRFGQKKKSTATQQLAQPSSSAEPKPHFSGDQMGMSSAIAEGSEPVHSSQLLAKMRARNNLVVSENANTESPEDQNDDLLVQMRNFIALQCTTVGQATTQEILNEFGSKLPQSDSVLFRSMLRQICTFKRDSSTKKGIWVLKDEFR
ncbi:DNA excision repair protein ERCC-6-like isoform X3 [Porites lutea]|uniref:DNA excision repair protein ERCC-6-like isoform X3 n=1 Tax=Porites lutea TaxID=51062 RepID=UPI003CC6B5D1